MACYKIEWKCSAEKEFSKIDKQLFPKIIFAVEKLSNDLHPIYSKKLIGYENIYRLRVGNYRIIYHVMAENIIIEIINIGHRKEIYWSEIWINFYII